MRILGVELDFDFCDADQAEVYEREAGRAAERAQDRSLYEGKGSAEGIRIQCRIIDDFFDAVFGAGTASQLFSGTANLREHLEAFAAVADAAVKAREEIARLADKYTPNRAEGRLAQKQEKKMTGQGHDSSRLIGVVGEKGPSGRMGPGAWAAMEGTTGCPKGPTGPAGHSVPKDPDQDSNEEAFHTINIKISKEQADTVKKFMELDPAVRKALVQPLGS